MRVIAGSKRSIPLYSLPGEQTRPTTDRIKETLFNMIAGDIPDAVFLDLYAGSGQIGIEALSRGAKSAVFCDNNHQAVSVIGKNLAKTGLNNKATVFACDAMTALQKSSSRGLKFDIIYLDPPYAAMTEEKILVAIRKLDLLAENGYIIIEASADRDFSFIEGIGFTLSRSKQYKTNQHIFITAAADATD